ncbi:MAG: DUF4388 domain-containing protein [Deltaproteobacteria bacterium]|nr:DUF4388 domain-containing protein [Nannocystaceae bacterium]
MNSAKGSGVFGTVPGVIGPGVIGAAGIGGGGGGAREPSGGHDASASGSGPINMGAMGLGGPGVLYFDPNPTTAKLAMAGLRLAGYAVMHAATPEQAVDLCRTHGPAGDRSIVALLLDTATAPAVSAAVLRALVEVPGASDLPGVLLVSRANPTPFPGAEKLPSLKRPFTTPALLKVVRDTIDQLDHPNHPPPAKLARARQAPDDAVLRLEIALQQFFPDLEPDTETLRRFLGMLNSMSELPRPAAGVTVQAELGAARLESMLEMLDADGARGVLSIERDRVRMRLHVDRGRIRMAEVEGSDGGGDLQAELGLGRYVIELGTMSAAEYDRIAAAEDARQRPIGVRLVEDGALRLDDLSQALCNQAREVVCHVIGWPSGRMSFAPSEDLHPVVVRLARGRGELRISEALLVALRRQDEKAEMGPHMAGLDEVYVRVDDEVAKLGRHAFSRDELGVLELLNGRHSVKDIARRTRTGTFAVAKVIYRLGRSGLARRRTPTVRT